MLFKEISEHTHILMNKLSIKIKSGMSKIISVFLVFQSIFMIGMRPGTFGESAPVDTPTRRVNVPYLQDLPFEPAIFWFGEVTPTNNNIVAVALVGSAQPFPLRSRLPGEATKARIAAWMEKGGKLIL